MLTGITPQDFAATIASILLVLAVVALAVLQRPIPSELGTALGAAITWLFVRAAQVLSLRRSTPPNPPARDP